MRKEILTIIFLCVCNYALPQDWVNSVIVRADNDYVSYKDTISKREATPMHVKEKILSFFNTLEISQDDMEYQQSNSIFRVSCSKDVDL